MITHECDGVGAAFREGLARLDRSNPRYAGDVVALLLDQSRTERASDLHLTPTPEGLEALWRIDGVLHPIGRFPIANGPNIIARLKVLADLLTYRCDTPQEGRIRAAPGGFETRVSTFPTLHGEKAVVRMFAASDRYQRLDDLGLPGDVARTLRDLLEETAGLVLLCGPAGSGKTTSLYACLRELSLAHAGRRSIVTLEDPIEVAVPGVSQSQVNAAAGFTLEIGLRSLMRQDPEVIGVGEVRDRAVAEVAFQAALTGHLVVTTFHAGSAAGALGRLADLGIEPYVLRSGVNAVVFQRLARRLCVCARPLLDPADWLGLPVSAAHGPVGCPACGATGYSGRFLLAELAFPGRGALAKAVLERRDIDGLEAAAECDGVVSRWSRAAEAVNAGLTSPAEIRRVFGLGPGRLEANRA